MMAGQHKSKRIILKPDETYLEQRTLNPAILSVLTGKENEGLLKCLVAQGLLDAVGYDYEVTTVKTTKYKDATKTETTKRKGHQPANHNLLIFFITNIAKHVGSNDWQQKLPATQDNRQIHINIDGQIESDRIREFARGYLPNLSKRVDSQTNIEGSGSDRETAEVEQISQKSNTVDG